MSTLDVVGGVLITFLILIVVAFLLLLRRISAGTLKRPSGLFRGFGLRTPSTLASDEAWRAGHQAIVPWLRIVIAIACVGVIASICAFRVASAQAGFTVSLASTLVVIVTCVILSGVGSAAASRVPKKG